MLIILVNYQTWWGGGALHNSYSCIVKYSKPPYMTLVGGTCESGGKEFDDES